MTETIYRAKAGVSEWSIHLWRNNGHDIIYSRHQVLDSVAELEEAQAAAAAELHRLEATDGFVGDGGHWWADLQHGTWQPTEHDVDGDTIYDATWVPSGRQYTGHVADAGDVNWEQL